MRYLLTILLFFGSIHTPANSEPASSEQSGYEQLLLPRMKMRARPLIRTPLEGPQSREVIDEPFSRLTQSRYLPRRVNGVPLIWNPGMIDTSFGLRQYTIAE